MRPQVVPTMQRLTITAALILLVGTLSALGNAPNLARLAHLPPFARGFPRELKPTQLIGWGGLDAGCSGACGWLFLETTPAPPTSATPPALPSVLAGSCRPAATTLV